MRSPRGEAVDLAFYRPKPKEMSAFPKTYWLRNRAIGDEMASMLKNAPSQFAEAVAEGGSCGAPGDCAWPLAADKQQSICIQNNHQTKGNHMRTSMNSHKRAACLILLAAAYITLVGPVAGQQPSIVLSAYALQPTNNLIFHNWAPQQITIDAVKFSILDDMDPPTPWEDFGVEVEGYTGLVTVDGDGIYPNISPQTTVNGNWFADFGGSVVPVDGGFTVTFTGFPDGTKIDLWPTPEPSTFALFGLGTFSLLAYQRRRRMAKV
jgi:hypothetical protein